MSAEQQEAYEGAEQIGSDPFKILDRDNRNHREKRRLIADALPVGADGHVLEVGCGDGIHAEWYEQFFTTFEAVDLSASLCRQTANQAPDSRVVQADARSLPYRDDAVDAVVGTAVLHHLPDAGAALREWHRVAREAVVLMEPNALFPKELITTFVLPEEQHKIQLLPWRIRQTLTEVGDETGWNWSCDPQLYTPPWPRSLRGTFDSIDAVASRVPGLRWSSQMLRLTLSKQ